MTDLLNRLVYLDRDFIVGFYEEQTGNTPITHIIKTENINAGAKIPIFSAGLSASESRTYAISTMGMLRELLPTLEKIPVLSVNAVGVKKVSTTGWVIGELSIFKVDVNSIGKEHAQLSGRASQPVYGPPLVASETYFAIHGEGLRLALITTADYFSSGLNKLTALYETILEETTIPVKALVRVMSSRSTFNEWIAVPLLVLEER